MNDSAGGPDPFAHLRQQAGQRADRTVGRLEAGIAALRTAAQKVTAESIKQATRDLEPGFAGLSFQVIRRNARAYGLYCEAADAFTGRATPNRKLRGKWRRRTKGLTARSPRSSYDPLEGLSKRALVFRIHALEHELEAERQLRTTLAYDQQVLRSRILRLETDLVLVQAERSRP